jgi:hypothetical protein
MDALIRPSRSVDFLHHGAGARIHQHHPLTGIDVAILGEGRTPIRRYGHKFNIARHLGANDDLFLCLDRANLVFRNLGLDLGSILRLDLNRCGRRARRCNGGLSIGHRRGKRRRRSEHQ